jgi:glycosyltransferase involved in cell wall biosynthesis
MNILIFNWRDIKNPKSGGAEIVTMEHAKAWIKEGHVVYWFSPKFKNSKKEEDIDKVKVIRQGSMLSVFLYAMIYYLKNRKKIDIVIDQIHGIPFFTPLYVRKPKLVLIHEVAGPIWDFVFPFPINLIGKTVEPLFFKLYKKEMFWVPSNSTVQDLINLEIKKKNIRLIYCGINNKVLSKLPVKEKKLTFIFVSRVVKMKGADEVIKSFSIIRKEIKNSQLWIVGDCDQNYKKTLLKTIENNSISEYVKFFGRVPDVEKLKLMSRAHLLLHASIKEGWGIVVIEAASQATPAVVYNVGGLRDSVINDRTGIVVSSNSPDAMARSALQLTKDKDRYKKMQLNGLEWARSLDWEKSTKQSLELIKDVAR